MLIGELAHRTGVATRLLRYYEEQGLLRPRRDTNGYRSYPEAAVARVARIRDLLAAGLNTEEIADLLPCAEHDGPVQACEKSVRIMADRTAELDRRIADLDRQRSRLAAQLDASLANNGAPIQSASG
ncbi:MerR family transcriptional regulator [Nocardia caishijiensis]|uniref:DNA-binding transcriptional MerR regulator n=1 Tax=Nocardia caishijiensis TaxID=184756 RepID=A0ABQ6YLP4_9NOCA|nr:MerR family transcriptional regulator [Nocardia caishijiensis]KAF0846439.1 DNA-binding transcriptional MerR regulator [Nocardia caishijiensis]